MAPRLSRRAYAKHRGVSEAAVRKAIASKRLTDGVSVFEDGIDPIAADREWAERTDVTKPLNSLTGNPKHRKETPGGPSMPIGMQVSEESGNSAQRSPDGAVGRFMHNKALREEVKARMEQLTYAERVGQLLRADEVRSSSVAAAQRVRDQLLALPDRIDQQLAAESDPIEVNRILVLEIRRICTALSQYAPALPEGAVAN